MNEDEKGQQPLHDGMAENHDDSERVLTENHDDSERVLTENHDDSDVDDGTGKGRRARPTGDSAGLHLKAGALILGRYEVLSELGRGGMGVVYRCFDRTSDTEVAVKSLPPEVSHNDDEMEDVKENYTLVSKLVHQNIAAYKTLEKDGDGNYFVVMEYVQGEKLSHWLRSKRREKMLTLETALPILRQVAKALDFAHSNNVIHRDVKPANVMVKADGTVKVLDFGLAAQIRTSYSHLSTVETSKSGTKQYMSPEQWRGKQQGAATDQYALAAMAYEILGGYVPFDNDDPSVLREIVLKELPSSLEDYSDAVNAVLTQGLAKDAKQRFASCMEFVSALEKAGMSMREEDIKDNASDLPEWYRTFMKLMPEIGVFQHVKLGEGLVPYAFGSDTGALLIYPMSCGSVEDAVKNLLATKSNLQEVEPDTGQEMILLMDEGQIDNTRELKKLGILCLDIAQFIAFAVTYYSHSNEQFRTGMMAFWNGDYNEAFKSLNVDDPTDSQVQYMLGFMYEHGKGVSQDMEMAKKLYWKAAHQGDKAAIKALRTILDQEKKQIKSKQDKIISEIEDFTKKLLANESGQDKPDISKGSSIDKAPYAQSQSEQERQEEHEAAISAAKKRYETAIRAGDWADAEIAARDRAAFGDGTFDQWYKKIEAARQEKTKYSTISEKKQPPSVLELSLTHSAERALQAQWKWPIGLESCIWGISESQPTCLKDIERHKWNRLPRPENGMSVVTLPSVGKGEQWVTVFGVVGSINHEIASEPNALCITKMILRYQLTGGRGLFGFGKTDTHLVVESSTYSFPEFEIRAGEKNEVLRGNGRIVNQPSWSPVTKLENGWWRMSCLLEGSVFKHEHIRLFLKHPELVNCEVMPVSSDKCEVK
ncbi:MAG: protein kinase [Victivallales bacterium]|nr:protein kinase [Victivallales bacterium]